MFNDFFSDNIDLMGRCISIGIFFQGILYNPAFYSEATAELQAWSNQCAQIKYAIRNVKKTDAVQAAIDCTTIWMVSASHNVSMTFFTKATIAYDSSLIKKINNPLEEKIHILK